MKAKKLLFHIALLIGFILLGCSNDASSDSNSASLGPKAPIGKKNQTFIQGATVSDIVVQGENVKWYKLNYTFTETPVSFGDDLLIAPLNSENRILLSPQTLLRDKNVYFATQTINNVESKEYLAVAVKIQNAN